VSAKVARAVRGLAAVAGLCVAVAPAAAAGGVRAAAASARSRVAACPHANTPADHASARTMRAAIVCLVNQERRRFGLPRLRESVRLDRSAEGHSDDMARRDYFAHVSPGGSSPFDRISATGYRSSAAGENIATGFPTPASVITAWTSAVGHCQNILDPLYAHIGVGVNPLPLARFASGPATWTQDFGLPAGAAPPSHNGRPAEGGVRGVVGEFRGFRMWGFRAPGAPRERRLGTVGLVRAAAEPKCCISVPAPGTQLQRFEMMQRSISVPARRNSSWNASP